VPWRIRDDELAPRRGKIAISNIDRDALFAFGAQSIRQQRKINLPRRRSSLAWSS
jgi:hypothetical protein